MYAYMCFIVCHCVLFFFSTPWRIVFLSQSERVARFPQAESDHLSRLSLHRVRTPPMTLRCCPTLSMHRPHSCRRDCQATDATLRAGVDEMCAEKSTLPADHRLHILQRLAEGDDARREGHCWGASSRDDRVQKRALRGDRVEERKVRRMGEETECSAECTKQRQERAQAR